MSKNKITIDTQLRLPGTNVIGTLFRHLENGEIKLLMVTGYSRSGEGKGRIAYVADLVVSPGLHWEVTKESFMNYVTRRMDGKAPTVAYNDWTVQHEA